MSIVVNNKKYEDGSIIISISNNDNKPDSKPLTINVKNLLFSDKFDSNTIYDAGKNSFIDKGQWRANGKIEITKEEFEKLSLITTNGILNSDPRFNMISAIIEEKVGPYTSITLEGIRFLNIKQMDLNVSIDFLILIGIKINGKSSRS